MQALTSGICSIKGLLAMANFRVLVSDPISEIGVSALADHPLIDVDVNTGLAPEELLKIIGEYDALVVRSQTKVTRDVIAAAPKLKAVGRAGVGVDNIDREAATDHGVVVMNTPTGNTISTAEHAFTLMLSLARSIPQAHASLLAGRWDRKLYVGVEMNEKRLAILGMGRIGTEFAKRAQAFGMTVVAYDPFLSEARAQQLKVELASTAAEALSGADVVTLHMPLNEQTKYILNADGLASMNPGALIVNCARGGLVDEAALKTAIDSGHIGGCALDVFENEPPSADHPLFSCPKTAFTPHLGASTAEAQENVGIQVAEQIRDYLADGSIVNAINMPNLNEKTLSEIGPYLEVAESIGALISKLAPQQPDTLRVSYHGAVSELDTSLISRTILRAYLESARNDAQVNIVNAPAIAKELGLRVSESSSTGESQFTELITAEIVKGDQSFDVSGTFVGNTPRIVAVDGMHIETNIKGNYLIVRNDDSPGIVGTVGSTLAKHQCNIANMSLARNQNKNCALNIIELDSVAPSELLEELRQAKGILEVTSIVL